MRARFGRCLRGLTAKNQLADSDEVRRVDEELDALGSRELAPDDPTLQLLAALAADVDDGEEQQPRSARGVRVRRSLVSRAVLTTSFTIVALSGTGIAAATVAGGPGPFQPIQQAVKALYEPSAAPSEDVTGQIRGLLDEARSDIDVEHFGDARRALDEARELEATLDASGGSGLAASIDSVEFELARALKEEGPGVPIASASRSDGDGQQPEGLTSTGTPSASPTGTVEAQAPTTTASPTTTGDEHQDKKDEESPDPSPEPSSSPGAPSPTPSDSDSPTDGAGDTTQEPDPDGQGTSDDSTSPQVGESGTGEEDSSGSDRPKGTSSPEGASPSPSRSTMSDPDTSRSAASSPAPSTSTTQRPGPKAGNPARSTGKTASAPPFREDE